MGLFKKKKVAERVVQSVREHGVNKAPELKSGHNKKTITRKVEKRKSLRKRLGSVFRRKANSLAESSTKEEACHEASIQSPAATHHTLETETSNKSQPVDLDHGYEIILENGNNAVTPIHLSRPKESSKILPVCGYDYEYAVKGITNVDCSPLDDWNNLVEFLMVPDMKKDIKRLVFGDEESDDIDTPPVKVIHTPPSSPIPYDEMTAEDPTFYDEQRQLNSLIDRQDDDDTYIIDAKVSVTSESVASMSVASSLPHETDSSSVVQHSDTVLNKILAENSSSSMLPTQVARPQASEEEVYDTSFTLRFLREVTQVGIMLEYFKATGDGGAEDNMKSTLVTISVKPGVSRGSRVLEPRLFWKEMNSPCDTVDDGISISLLGVHSIHTSLSLNDTDDDESPFFTITTETGDVHAFESPTISERNYVVHGIKNVVAWLSYHLIMGNMSSGTEVVTDLEVPSEDSGDLPSLRTPVQAMNDLAHSFLD